MAWITKPYRYAVLYTSLLASVSSFILLDAFVIPHAQTVVSSTAIQKQSNQTTQSSTNQTAATTDQTSGSTTTATKSSDTAITNTATATTQSQTTATTAQVTDTSYQDGELSIQLTTTRQYDTDIYIAEIKTSDPSNLKTALANNTFGRNIKATTSDIAADNQAILAINGDYYGFRDDGAVLRNGELLRTTQRQGHITEALVIDNNGNFTIMDESQTDLATMDTSNIQQILSFGPALVNEGEIVVGEQDEVSTRSHSNQNPRTAIAMVAPGHYYMVVTDGRTNSSTGLTLYQLATVLQNLGAKVAYNLDGGGSSTMVFNGKVVNNPTTNGQGNQERAVSDIVYFSNN